MREDWKLMEFEDLCELTRGHNPPKSKFINEPKKGYVRFYQIRDGWSDNYKVYVPDTNQLHTVLPADMLMVAYRHIGKVFRGVTGAFNVALCKISNKNNDILNDDYIFYMIPSEIIRGELMKRSERSLIPSMSVVHLKSLMIPVPPIQEQKQIVEILDKAFTAIDQAKANIEKNIVNATALFQSKLNEIFSQKGDGWKEKSLGELGKVSMCKRILKNQTTPDGDIPFYKIGTFGKKANAFIPKEIYDDFINKYSFPKKGDILISASGTIGRRVIYDGLPAYFQDSNIVWIDNNEVLVTNEYLYQFYGVCDWNPSKGATISRLYNSDLRRINISFPNIKEQKQIVPNMVKLSEQTLQIESNYIKKLADLEELKKSILQKAFSGELTQKEVEV
jgi:type I restriction enzyme S subunit